VLWKPYGCDGLQVIGLNTKETDPFNDILPALSQITFPVLDDFGHSNLYFQDLGWVSAFPLNVIVDGDGIIRFAYRGHAVAGMEMVIQELLGGGSDGSLLGNCQEEN
jgi:hypothetical protein